MKLEITTWKKKFNSIRFYLKQTSQNASEFNFCSSFNSGYYSVMVLRLIE